MEYTEIADLMSVRNLFSTAEQLRVAVDEEADSLRNGPLKPEASRALELAREYYAEDITAWLESGATPDPETLLGMRARYTKTWAFAQIIHRCLQPVDEKARSTIGARAAVAAVQRISVALDAAKAPTINELGNRNLEVWERVEAILVDFTELRDRVVELGNRDLQADVKTAAKNLIWACERNHQGYHGEDGGHWRDCSKGICGSMEHMLAQVGLDKELKPCERAV